MTKESYQDPTTDDDRWVVVDIEPVKAMKDPVTLAAVKSDGKLKDTGQGFYALK